MINAEHMIDNVSYVTLHAGGNTTGHPGEGKDGAEEQEHMDELLDEALDETFPASDPVALTPGRDDEAEESDADTDN